MTSHNGPPAEGCACQTGLEVTNGITPEAHDRLHRTIAKLVGIAADAQGLIMACHWEYCGSGCDCKKDRAEVLAVLTEAGWRPQQEGDPCPKCGERLSEGVAVGYLVCLDGCRAEFPL